MTHKYILSWVYYCSILTDMSKERGRIDSKLESGNNIEEIRANLFNPTSIYAKMDIAGQTMELQVPGKRSSSCVRKLKLKMRHIFSQWCGHEGNI